jgi:hypothetical protein
VRTRSIDDATANAERTPPVARLAKLVELAIGAGVSITPAATRSVSGPAAKNRCTGCCLCSRASRAMPIAPFSKNSDATARGRRGTRRTLSPWLLPRSGLRGSPK